MTAPDLSELLRTVIDTRLANVWTAIPGKIESYDASKQVADVRPMIKRIIPNLADDADDIPEDLPVLPSVPVVWLRAGGFFLHAPLEAGNGVLLVICHSDPQGWRRTGNVSEPGDQRLHSLAHAVAIPGLETAFSSLGGMPSDALVLGREGGLQVEFKSATMEVGGSSDAVPKDSALQTELGLIAAALNSIAGAIPTTNPYTTPGATASSKLKIGG